MNKLTEEETRVIINKGTEAPFVGEYTDHFVEGVYACRQCDTTLYTAQDKFHSGCGWPSFDDEIKNSLIRIKDNSFGMQRVEICCANCKGHLGHVFEGERLTEKNLRHCVNSISRKV